MKKIIPNLYVADQTSGHRVDSNWKIIHACKHPCHYNKIGLQFRGRRYSPQLVAEHPEYLVYETGNHLYINVIDGHQQYFSIKIFDDALRYIQNNIDDTPVVVHCNLGQSRSPSIVLLYLAKAAHLISNTQYFEAKKEFMKKYYPAYNPGTGIEIYLKIHWDQLGVGMG